MEKGSNSGRYGGTDYELMGLQMESLMEQDRNWLPVLSNASAVLMTSMESVNWAGFYILRADRLVLGPCGAAQEDAGCGRCPSVSRTHCVRQRIALGDRRTDL